MPKVMYKTKDGMKTKMFPYTKAGTEQAKEFAKLVNGKVDMSMKGPFKKTPSNIAKKVKSTPSKSFKKAVERAQN